jgi:hypothetical protein
VEDVREFMKKYGLDCDAAYHRLVVIGAPDDSVKPVAEATQHFITLMDSLKLNMRAVYELQPLLNDLIHSFGKIPKLPKEFETGPKQTLQKWLDELNSKEPSFRLSEEQSQDLFFRVDSAYNEFHRVL